MQKLMAYENEKTKQRTWANSLSFCTKLTSFNNIFQPIFLFALRLLS